MSDPFEKIDQAAVEAVKATNYCTKHSLYHGQKYKSCTPQERTMITIKSNPNKESNDE